MKTYIVIISYILLIYPWSALSQKEDYVWVSGHVYRNDGLGNLKIDFNAQPPILSSIPYAFTFSSTNNCISDANGALQLMTNGIQIKDAQGRILEGGGAKLIPDSNYYVDDQSFTGLNFVNGTLLLPVPETKETYALFHYNLRESANPDLLVEFDTLYMSTIKKNNQGRYYISEFRKKILLASIDFYLTSVRHANGKDWWIVALGRLTNRLYVMRLGKDGAEFSHSQGMGLTIGNVCGAQTKFTPDGKKFIWFACCSGIHIKDFDRRTGKFCNPVYIPRWDFNESFHSGVECSPSSQYVYVNTEVSVWQLDITVKDIAASKIKLAQIDRFASDSSFAYEQLAPNNKIYISGSRNHLHVIDKPNL